MEKQSLKNQLKLKNKENNSLFLISFLKTDGNKLSSPIRYRIFKKILCTISTQHYCVCPQKLIVIDRFKYFQDIFIIGKTFFKFFCTFIDNFLSNNILIEFISNISMNKLKRITVRFRRFILGWTALICLLKTGRNTKSKMSGLSSGPTYSSFSPLTIFHLQMRSFLRSYTQLASFWQQSF